MSEDVRRDESSALATSVQEVIEAVAASQEGHDPGDIFVALKAELAKRVLTPAIPNETLRSYAAAHCRGGPSQRPPEGSGGAHLNGYQGGTGGATIHALT